mmetsp:Transcript_397/g.475  ORF Transcript_397/g.475 Transcript_397/m.475 type:complete len:130 (+) Transcript_397:187-576(+)|eukprot:CAMPEP_0184055930 /NCGR_PEP_ID=MMETSP0956-20121227/7464_1 /TAXON_ID=627963 /ORGANISM="Aplanochytrium sp, Strain PBS07" /LENGTH=129 /DNA_ID=CAMNT_0026349837 /DNA_START=70 /DNA_END=459 /DNA_ORIENTATION=-
MAGEADGDRDYDGTLASKAEDILKILLDYEKSIRSVLDPSCKATEEKKRIISEFREHLDKLNNACDDLRQETERKCSVGTSFTWLQNASEIEDNNPQAYIQKAAKSLCSTRSKLLKVLNDKEPTAGNEQ